MKQLYFFLILLISFQLAAQMPSDSLVAYYPFYGNANDVSGNGQHGVVYSATLATDRFGYNNACYHFTPTQSIEGITNTFPYGNIDRTISLWVYFDSLHLDVNNVFSYGSPATDSINAFYVWKTADDKIYLRYSGYNSDVSYRKDDFQSQQWHHIAMTYKSDTASIYLNGNKLKSVYYPTWNTDSTDFKIGSGQGFYGKVDDIRIYKKALNTNEINLLAREGTCYDTIAVEDTLNIDIYLTGIPEPNNKNEIKVYPNPAKDIINIDCGNHTSMANYQLKITNASSAIVWSTTVTQKDYTIDISTLGSTGIYFLEIYDDNTDKIEVKKIVLY